MIRLPLVVAAALVVALGASACSGEEGGTSVSTAADHRFEPEVLTVSVGDAVTWTNDGSEAHTVTAYGDDLPLGADYWASGGASSEAQARDSVGEGLLSQGETFEMTFEEPGTFAYFCIPHESDSMKGKVVVEG